MMNHMAPATRVPPAANQPRLIPAAKRTEAPPASTRMVPDMWGSISISRAITIRVAP